MSFQPSNITSFKDLDNKYREQIALLRVQAENEKKIMDALRGKESGILPQFELPVSLEERLQDENFQRSQALKNLKDLFDDSMEASRALNLLTVNQIKYLNRLFPFIQSDFGTKYSQFDAPFFIDYLERLIEVTESQKGYLARYTPSSIEDTNPEVRENVTSSPEGGVESFYDLDDLLKNKGPPRKSRFDPKYLARITRGNTLSNYINDINDFKKELLRKTEPVTSGRVSIKDRKTYDNVLKKLIDTLDQYLININNRLQQMEPMFSREPIDIGDAGIAAPINTGNAGKTRSVVDMIEEEEETKEEVIPTTVGTGMRRYGRYTKGGRLNTRVIMGRGLSIEQPLPNNVEFGKFMLNQKQLRNGILSMKYKSGGPIPEIKKTQISDNLKDFIFDLLDSQKINQSLYKKLSMDDKKLFRKIVTLAHLNKKLGVKDLRDDDEDIKRFELVRGQYLAGNNADSVKHELVKLIYKFSLGGKISVNDAEDIITSLIH